MPSATDGGDILPPDEVMDPPSGPLPPDHVLDPEPPIPDPMPEPTPGAPPGPTTPDEPLPQPPVVELGLA
jgi:protein TonB